MTTASTTPACAYCLDGYAPAGITAHLGPIFRPCAYCSFNGAIAVCVGCFNESAFPADFSCLHCLAEHLAAEGMAAALCHRCGGITELIPLDQIPPEANP